MVLPRYLTKKIQGWTRMHCNSCGRPRTHFRVGDLWYCIGKLPKGDRVAAKDCGRAA